MEVEGIYVYGASGHGKVVAEIAETLGINITGFMDDDPRKLKVFDYPVYNDLPFQVNAIIAIGDNKIRKSIVTKNPTFQYISLVHPLSTISLRSSIERGTVVMAGVSINSSVLIGKHCIVNTNSSIDHDCRLENFVHIGPNVALAGNVYIGEGTQIGIGACILPGIKIGKWCVIGAGAVITNDIPDFSVVVGNPGKIIKSIKIES